MNDFFDFYVVLWYRQLSQRGGGQRVNLSLFLSIVFPFDHMSFPYLFSLFSHSAHLSLNKDLAEQIENFGSSSNKCMCIFICDVLLPSSYSHHTYDVSFASKLFNVLTLFVQWFNIYCFPSVYVVVQNSVKFDKSFCSVMEYAATQRKYNKNLSLMHA